jgi:hypothetical protein
MQSIYPFSIKDFSEAYIALLECYHPDGKVQAGTYGKDAEGVSAQ